MSVYIEIRDADNSIVGQLDIGNSEDSPFTLTKEVSDFRDFKKRSGLYSFDFSVPLTDDNIELLPNIYSSSLKNTKAFFKNKEAIVYDTSMEIARGELRIKRIETDEQGNKYLSCEFLGDNLAWISDFGELSLSELNFADTSFTYDYDAIVNSWNNTADTNDFVFSHIQRGTSGGAASPYTNMVEEFRPDLFVKRILTTAFTDIGYELESTFFDTSSFKGLVMPYFTSDPDNDRWINDNDQQLSEKVDASLTSGNVQFNVDAREIRATALLSTFVCKPSVQSRSIPLDTAGGGNSGVYNTSTHLFSGFTYFGNYSWQVNVNISNMVSNTANWSVPESSVTSLVYYNSRTGKRVVDSFSGANFRNFNTSITADIQSGDNVYFYLLFDLPDQVSGVSSDCSTRSKSVTYTISDNSSISGTITDNISSYGAELLLSDVLSKDYMILELMKSYELFYVNLCQESFMILILTHIIHLLIHILNIEFYMFSQINFN